MLLCAEYVLPVSLPPINKGAVLVRNGKIEDIGQALALVARYPDEEVRDFGQAALMPGFVNIHTHLEYTAMRGIVHDVPYVTWLLLVHSKGDAMTTDDLESSAIEQRVMRLISENYIRAYKVCSSGKDDAEKLYLRLMLVTDYICGMTDGYARKLYRELSGIE